MTATPDTETRLIIDLMLALGNLIGRCDLAQEAGSQCLSIVTVRTIAAEALIHAQDSAQPSPAAHQTDGENHAQDTSDASRLQWFLRSRIDMPLTIEAWRAAIDAARSTS